MLQFPLGDLLNEQLCHDFLLLTLHPNGMHCPSHVLPVSQASQARHRTSILDYRCLTCGAVFNLFVRLADPFDIYPPAMMDPAGIPGAVRRD